jgi:hypothetical protein
MMCACKEVGGVSKKCVGSTCVSEICAGPVGESVPTKPTWYPQKSWFTAKKVITCNYANRSKEAL